MYIKLTLQAIITVLSSNVVSQKLEIKQTEINHSLLALIHRLRVSRTMLVLHLMNQFQIHLYLDSLDKSEA